MTRAKKNLPKHIAIIMDGNRRWARRNKMKILAGHDYAAHKTIENLIQRSIELKIPYLTLWAFSTENWKRDKKEVQGLLKIFAKGLQEDMKRFDEMGVRLNHIGDITRFPPAIREGFQEWEEKTKKNKKITVTMALNYGGRDEILRAIKRGKFQIPNSKFQIRKETFSSLLDTASLPDPDLIIRTGGEKRLSGFMLWQAEYSELYFTDCLFPDFTPKELDKAIEEYQRRQRRHGR